MDSFFNLAIFSGSVKIEILSRRKKKVFFIFREIWWWKNGVLASVLVWFGLKLIQ